MGDFQFSSDFWSWWIIVLTIANLLACWWLIAWAARKRPGEAATGNVTGHKWDEDLEEYNNPLPRWWLWLFHITLIFALVYLALYPGLGKFRGYLGWTEEKQYEEQMAAAEEKYAPIFRQYAQKPIPALAGDEEARAVGRRLFVNYCAQCHAQDASGQPGRGYPSLRDGAWLYGGSPEAIKSSILDGRPQANKGQIGMPPQGTAIGGEEGAEQVANYVRSLSGLPHDSARARAGKEKFAVCAGCHGMDGTGNTALGAPDLTDDFWLYGSEVADIKESILKGRKGKMPAHRAFLGEDKVHLLAAYVYSLSEHEE